MTPSAQSQAVLAKLLAGHTAKSRDSTVVLGPLSSAGRVLLKAFLDNFEDLDGRSGQDQIEALRKEYVLERKTEKESSETVEAGAGRPLADDTADSEERRAAEWRVESLQASSIRGIAPPGEEFEFDLGAESVLLFGPNGSGKSSLLSAICWVLTGEPLTDSHEVVEAAPLYTVPASGERGSRFRDWPVVVTLPDKSECRTANPTCWAEITLRDRSALKELRLRRTFGAELEAKEDDSPWEPCEDLADYGISPLDVQLSLVAPTIFGRRTIESAKNTRDILSMMLGYDDLEKLGALCSRMSRNRTLAAKTTAAEKEGLCEQIGGKLSTEAQRLPEEASVKEAMDSLAAKPSPSSDEIAAVGKKVSEAIEEAEGSLADLLGLKTTEGTAPEGLADKLTVAVAKLEEGLWQLFPSIGVLRPSSVFPGVADEDLASRLTDVNDRMNTFVSQVESRIRDRLEWWKKESAPGSNASLLLKASKFYDPEEATCPVCEKPIDSLPVSGQLTALKDADPELAKELRTFFADLCEELADLLPPGVKDLAATSLKQRVMDDWQALKDAVLVAPLAPLAADTDERIGSFAESLAAPVPAAPAIVPEDVDKAFKEAAEDLLSEVTLALRSIQLVRWASVSLAKTDEGLKSHITDVSPTSRSLLAQLAKGKGAAAQAKPLLALREELCEILKIREKIAKLQETLAILEELRGALEELKPLSKYATAQVSVIFESIKDQAIVHWGKMYPESSTGMKPGRLVLGSGRDKSVEALLSCDTYEVPGQHFANAGLQRAIALAFYFALLDKHPKGLGFILLDDPILSLDDDHRERWSQEVLRRRIDEFQVVLATHQRQYLLHCRHHFSKEGIYELNPRNHAQRISVRPAHELEKAKAALDGDWEAAPTIMRKYRERVFLTLDVYSPQTFFNPFNYAASFDTYKSFAEPHILAGRKQRQLVEIFRDPEVDSVLDAGSHAGTGASLTRPMVEDCLEKLVGSQCIFEGELKRLDAHRERSLRTVEVPGILATFPEIPDGATWDSISMPFIGRAAARSDPWVVDVTEEALLGEVKAGALVLVTANSLDPVARAGQWAILAEEDVVPVEGDLVAAIDEEGNRLLRRLWSTGDSWILQAVNPVSPIACQLVAKAPAAMRKLVGVVYLGSAPPPEGASEVLREWAAVEGAPVAKFKSLQVIVVEGESLDPIARRGQVILVTGRLTDPRRAEAGMLAAIATNDDDVGNVLKRIYPQGDELVLVSPNPIDVTPPIGVSLAKVKAVWPLAGVLFEGMGTGASD